MGAHSQAPGWKNQSVPTYTTELPIRDELDAAHGEAMAEWSSAGTWWTGAQRLAMVAEVRRARDADTLAPWESPSAVDGLIPDGHPLPDAVVDLVWRLTNHPGTLTPEWHASILGRGVEALAYVEVVSIVAQVNCVDRFADALELDRVPVPEAQPGEPDGQVPADAEVRLHWVPTVDIGGPNVWLALSGVPSELEARSRLSTPHYLEGRAVFGDVVSDRFSLQRVQMELVAARTSKLNECFY
ncbi:MAG TPA: hypothetical protein DGK99_00275 [Acidimicrobiaceae bacterium]|nr:hypothetical protein [Acidimicrobiaceae bacterium]